MNKTVQSHVSAHRQHRGTSRQSRQHRKGSRQHRGVSRQSRQHRGVSQKPRKRSEHKIRAGAGAAPEESKVIAKGGVGCVVKPALPCFGNARRHNFVTKVGRKEASTNEWNKYEIIRPQLESITNHEKYFQAPVEMCDLDITASELSNLTNDCRHLLQNNSNKLLNKEEWTGLQIGYGGPTIQDHTTRGDIPFGNFHLSMLDLLENGIVQLNEKGINHNDIKPNNVVYDGTHVRLIDWDQVIHRRNRNYIRRKCQTAWQVPIAYSLMNDTSLQIIQRNTDSKEVLAQNLTDICTPNSKQLETAAATYAGEAQTMEDRNLAQMTAVVEKFYTSSPPKFRKEEYQELLRKNLDIYGWLLINNYCWANFSTIFSNKDQQKNSDSFHTAAKEFLMEYMYTPSVLVEPYNIEEMIAEYRVFTGLPHEGTYFQSTNRIANLRFDESSSVEAPLTYAWYYNNERKGTLKCYKCAIPECATTSCLTLPVCMSHLSTTYGVEIRPTTLLRRDAQTYNLILMNFNGLFALKAFKSGDFILPYIGKKLTQDQLNALYSGKEVGPYVTEGTDCYYDSAEIRGAGSWANTCARNQKVRKLRKHNGGERMSDVTGVKNAELQSYVNHPDAYPNIIATMDIAIGDEILLDYGEEYYKSDSIHRLHSTKCDVCVADE